MVNEKRLAVAEKYRTIIGRNRYSQAKRNCCYKKYCDGNYYSDCSSSVSLTYRECGYDFGNLNTAGMYTTARLRDVPVRIEKGIITNPEVLRIGDMLIFAGNDESRAYAGYAGHVEMVGEIDAGKVTIYGHGSGTPRATEMNAYCKSRYAKKAATKLGNRELISVRRYFADDDAAPEGSAGGYIVNAGTWNLRSGPGTGFEAITTLRGGTKVTAVDPGDWVYIIADNASGWITKRALKAVKA